jgi:hypothetical protein
MVYLENWHIDLIAGHLEVVTAGQTRRLLIDLSHNPPCDKGEDGKRKKMSFNMEIVQAGRNRYCSRFCAARRERCCSRDRAQVEADVERHSRRQLRCKLRIGPLR